MLLRPFLIPKDNIPTGDYIVLRTLLIPKGRKGVEKGEGLVNTSRKREKRGKTQEASTVNFGV